MAETTDQNKAHRPTQGSRVFLPTYRANDLCRVDWAAVYALGFRLVAVDLDNTLERHGRDEPDAYARESVSLMRQAGLDVMLYSNAAKQRDRRYADALGIAAIRNVAKPDPAALAAAMREHGLRPEQVLVVGDQLITDVWSANRLGVRSLWVKKRGHGELLTIRLKRVAEALIVRLHRSYFAGLPTIPHL